MQSSSKDRTGNSSPNESVFFNANSGKDNKVSRKGQKVGWSQEENVFLWEAYIRSKILSARTGRGYTFLMKEIWDGKDFSVRTQASLVVHVGRIKGGCYLSHDEREAVERRVREEFSVANSMQFGGNRDQSERREGGIEETREGGEASGVAEDLGGDCNNVGETMDGVEAGEGSNGEEGRDGGDGSDSWEDNYK